MNISIDTLKAEKFEFITRRKGFDRVWQSILMAVDSRAGLDSVKLNVVVMNGFNEDELIDFVELTKRLPVDVRFIEYMPFDGNKWSENRMFPYKHMMEKIKGNYQADLLPLNRHHSSSTSLPFKVNNYLGKIGFITSMTNNFCGSCNRLRLTADGNLKVRPQLIDKLAGRLKFIITLF